ncbi:probable carboxylesterase 15 [Nymphaea colorata]|nr:probable carboxylesterase 15 [Nymphaea colorata]
MTMARSARRTSPSTRPTPFNSASTSLAGPRRTACFPSSSTSTAADSASGPSRGPISASDLHPPSRRSSPPWTIALLWSTRSRRRSTTPSPRSTGTPVSSARLRISGSGDSAGANITHHLAVGLAGKGLSPVTVRAFVVLMPFFTGEEGTASERECPATAFLNLEVNDRYWRVALPRGETRDHPVANPFGRRSADLGPVELGPILEVDYARGLERMGKRVELAEFEGEQRGFSTVEPNSMAARALLDRVQHFVNETS